MSMGSAGEKTEKATPKKRREAREKGQVFKSVEVITAFSLLILFGTLSIFGGSIIENIEEMMKHFFTMKDLPDLIGASFIATQMQSAVVYLLQILVPILLAAFLCAVVFNALQVGLNFSSKAMQPKLERISLFKGFKRTLTGILTLVSMNLFGRNTCFVQFQAKPAHPVFGLLEQQYLFEIVLRQHLFQYKEFILTWLQTNDVLVDTVARTIPGTNLYGNGIAQDIVNY